MGNQVSHSISHRDQAIEKQPLIHIRDLKKSFGENHVLNGFNLDLYELENVIILGKSGSGKSVLLKCIVRLMDYDSGTIQVLGKDIKSLEQLELDKLRTDVGFLFQGSALYDSMTVRENLAFPLRRHSKRMEGFDEDDLIINSLRSVGLEEAIDLMPAELSGGMKRRVALARTLILKPKVILYDEPTTGLDPITAKEIINLILKVQHEYNTASLVITHDMDCARVLSDRLIMLVNGIDYAKGTYDELANYEDSNVQAFFK